MDVKIKEIIRVIIIIKLLNLNFFTTDQMCPKVSHPPLLVHLRNVLPSILMFWVLILGPLSSIISGDDVRAGQGLNLCRRSSWNRGVVGS